tara:strand:- start:1553 stop:3409 length:1857 start_codon:yes stop_codon:yes gene_type:complete
MISFPHEAVRFLRPYSVLEVKPNGVTRDITLRLCASFLGEDVFLDENNSYVILGVTPEQNIPWHGYHSGTAWSGKGSSEEISSELKRDQQEFIRRLLSPISLDNWSTNLGRKTNFKVHSIDIAQWKKVWTRFTSYVLTNDYDKLVEVAPWIGTKQESFIVRNFITMNIDSTSKTDYRRAHEESIAALKHVTSASWASEPPPLVIGYDCVEELLSSYKRAYRSRAPLGGEGYLADLSKLIRVTTSMLDTYENRIESNSIWRWVKDFTTLHARQDEVEHRFNGILDSCSARDLKGNLGTSMGTSGWSYPGKTLEVINSVNRNTPLLEALYSRLLEICCSIVKRDNSLNLNWKQLREEYELTAKNTVRRKGSLKRGERILKEVLDCVEASLLKSLPKYKEWVTGISPVVEAPTGFRAEDYSNSLQKETRTSRMISTSRYRGGILLAWAFSLKKSDNPLETKFPLSLIKATSDPEVMSMCTLVDLCMTFVNAGFPERAALYLTEIVKRYKEEERVTRSVSVGHLDTPFAVSVVSDGGGTPEPGTPVPAALTGFSVLAEFIYEACRKLEEVAPKKAAPLLEQMAEHMRELRKEEEPFCLRSEYRIIFLRDLADPEYWAPKTQA